MLKESTFNVGNIFSVRMFQMVFFNVTRRSRTIFKRVVLGKAETLYKQRKRSARNLFLYGLGIVSFVFHALALAQEPSAAKEQAVVSKTMMTPTQRHDIAVAPSQLGAIQDIELPNTQFELDEDQETVLKAVKLGKIQPFSELYQTLDQQLNGRVIKVELDEEDEEWVYELKLIHNNNVIKVEYDASTLEMLEIKGRNLNKVLKPTVNP